MALKRTVALAARAPMDPMPSGSFEEASYRSKKLFREVARQVPWILRSFQLEEVTTKERLREQLADEFRKYKHVKDRKTIDMLLFRAQDELTQIMCHDYQRHHLIEKFVQRPPQSKLQHGIASGQSKFLNDFLRGN